MKYENRIVLFLDILGFRNLIENTITNNVDNSEAILSLYNTLEDVGLFFKDNLIQDSLSTRVTNFSDSIVISFKSKDSRQLVRLTRAIQSLIINLVNRDILCRGAISYGKLIHTNTVVFGPALNDAYETETKAALYPRVILDKKIISLNENTNNSSLLSVLRKDSDEEIYIDYFAENLIDYPHRIKFIPYFENLRAIIINGARSNKPDIEVKYGWMKNNYNRLLRQLKS